MLLLLVGENSIAVLLLESEISKYNHVRK
jgi:hypothetical protein